MEIVFNFVAVFGITFAAQILKTPPFLLLIALRDAVFIEGFRSFSSGLILGFVFEAFGYFAAVWAALWVAHYMQWSLWNLTLMGAFVFTAIFQWDRALHDLGTRKLGTEVLRIPGCMVGIVAGGTYLP